MTEEIESNLDDVPYVSHEDGLDENALQNYVHDLIRQHATDGEAHYLAESARKCRHDDTYSPLSIGGFADHLDEDATELAEWLSVDYETAANEIAETLLALAEFNTIDDCITFTGRIESALTDSS